MNFYGKQPFFSLFPFPISILLELARRKHQIRGSGTFRCPKIPYLQFSSQFLQGPHPVRGGLLKGQGRPQLQGQVDTGIGGLFAKASERFLVFSPAPTPLPLPCPTRRRRAACAAPPHPRQRGGRAGARSSFRPRRLGRVPGPLPSEQHGNPRSLDLIPDDVHI